MSALIWPLRSLVNGMGLAWWARVETTGPDVTYWFGPFVKRSTLDRELPVFLEEIGSEEPESMTHTLLRTRRKEPFTIAAEG